MAIIYFILILTIVVCIHEFGHLLFAKKAGVYVYEFSIGMGPRLFKFKRKNDETEYSIRLLPIGGFVQMAGESGDEESDIPKDKNLQSKTWGQKLIIMLAGILFNFILAIVILFIVGLVNGCETSKPYLAGIDENNTLYSLGLRNDDLITSINGKKISTTDRLMLEYQVAYGKDITLGVKDKDGKIKKVTITPQKNEDDKGKATYTYGFSLKSNIEHGFFAAIKYAFTKFFSLMWQMLLIIWYLITGKLSISNLSGPIGIFTTVKEASKYGFINLVYLTGYISLNLGFMNLLPIPALDGCRSLFLIIGKIIGKPVNPKVENSIHTVGFSLLMILIIFVSYNDILGLIK